MNTNTNLFQILFVTYIVHSTTCSEMLVSELRKGCRHSRANPGLGSSMGGSSQDPYWIPGGN